jgi:hypothetical protein
MATKALTNNGYEYICCRDYKDVKDLPSLVMVWKSPREVMLIPKEKIKSVSNEKTLLDFI